MLKKLISFAFQKPQVETLIQLMNDDLKSARMLGIGDLWNIAIKAQGAEGIPEAIRNQVLADVEAIDETTNKIQQTVHRGL